MRSGKAFTIKFEDLVWPTHCPVLGIELEYKVVPRTQRANKFIPDNTPTFDQLRPGEGYIPRNVTIISWRANHIKSNSTPEEIRKLAEWTATTI